MNSSKITTVLAIACSLFSLPGQAAEYDEIPDTFKISLGAYVVGRYDSSMSLTDSSLGAGASISPSETLGLDLEQTVTRLDGYYRFTPVHALTYSWYKIKSTGNRTVDEAFDWLDKDGNMIEIPLGAQVNTVLEYDIYKLGYLWSFYHNDKVELSAGGGLHITRIIVGLDTDTTVPPTSKVHGVKSTIPLPVLSFDLKYNVAPRFFWYIKSEAFAISIGDWSGTFTDSLLGMEYRAWKNIALGAGLGSNALRIKEETSDYTFKYENRISGFNLYAAAYF